MKKTYVLIIASLLGSSPLITYAIPDLSGYLDDILPEGEDDEGVSFVDWKGPWRDPYYLPDNIKVVHDKVERLSLCSPNGEDMDDASINGRVMAPFTVKAVISKDSGATMLNSDATFTFPAPEVDIMGGGNNNGGGQAVATDDDGLLWKLTQHGSQTWDKPWTIELGEGVTLHSIEIDLLDKEGYGPKGGFDILLRPNDKPEFNVGDIHPSPGSGAGWPVQPLAPIKKSLSNVQYTATYSRPIVLIPDGFLGDPGKHDMYGKVTIDFVVENNGVVIQNGITKDSTDVDLAFIFWGDTDCLPISEFEAEYKGNGVATLKATGVNMNLYVMKEGDPQPVAGPFVLEMDETTIEKTVEGLEEGACYWVEDRNDAGHRELLYGPACVPVSSQ